VITGTAAATNGTTRGATQVLLRGGPSDGLHVTVLLDPQHRTIDCLNRTGYTYRDSGHAFHGLQIYDWLPSTGRTTA
jgi:hypothetical protein